MSSRAFFQNFILVLSLVCGGTFAFGDSIKKARIGYIRHVSSLEPFAGQNFEKKAKAARLIKSEEILSRELLATLRESVHQYYKTRQSISKALNQAAPFYKEYWLRRLEEKVISKYLLAVLEPVQTMATAMKGGEELSFIIKNFKYAVNAKKVSLDWLENVYYSASEQYGRGAFNHESQSLSLDLLPPNEILGPLIHEISHFSDYRLDRKGRQLQIEKEVLEKVSQKTMHRWNDEEKELFGRYWFYNCEYLTYFKELAPRINACVAVTEMSLQERNFEISKIDEDRYQRVLVGEETCHELTAKELRSELPIHNGFWSQAANPHNFSIVENFRNSWLKDLGFDSLFLQIDTSDYYPLKCVLN